MSLGIVIKECQPFCLAFFKGSITGMRKSLSMFADND